MRIAVVSDIHGNLPALEAVRPDLVAMDYPNAAIHAGWLRTGI